MDSYHFLENLYINIIINISNVEESRARPCRLDSCRQTNTSCIDCRNDELKPLQLTACTQAINKTRLTIESQNICGGINSPPGRANT